MECGRYELADGPQGYRGTRERPGPCPGCGQQVWADLEENAVVDVLVETDDRRWETRAWQRRGVTKLGAVAVGILAAVGSALARPRDISIVLFGPLLLVIVAAIVRGALSDIRAGRRPPQPTRWRGTALAQRRIVKRHAGVPAEPTDQELLVAPLSGRPCIAYELAVRRDSDVNGATWSWALVEQAVAPVRIAGHVVDPHTTGLELTRTPCPDNLDDAAVSAVLRMRGLDISRGSYQLFESIIDPAEAVEIGVDARGRARLCRAPQQVTANAGVSPAYVDGRRL